MEINRKNVKNINLRVKVPDGSVCVSAPKFVSDERIENFIISRIDWINYQILRVKKLKSSQEKHYMTGDKFLIFDEEFTLVIYDNQKKNNVIIKDNYIFIMVKGEKSQEKIEKTLNKKLKEILTNKLNLLIDKWEKITGLYQTGFSVKSMRTRWGSCNIKTYKLNFNLALVNKKVELIEYVVLHELAHTKVGNHGDKFKAILTKYMPDWKIIEKQLKTN